MPKAKRKLSEIDFSKDESHIALVGPAVGGPANGANYALVMKANNFSAEFLEKASKVRLTMNIQDFLQRFYHMYSDDAVVLARAFGYDTDTSDDVVEDYQEYLDGKVEAIEIIKSLQEPEGRDLKIASLNEDQYLTLIKSQETLEKVFAKIDKTKSETPVKGAKDSTTVEITNVEPAGSVELEKSMTVEMVEKSTLVAIEKTLADTKVELTKALEQVEVYKTKEKEAVTKARFDKVVAAVKDEEKATVLFKALNLIEDTESFDAAVETLTAMTATIEKSSLFEEKGAGAEPDARPTESAVAKVIKARQSAANKTKE